MADIVKAPYRLVRYSVDRTEATYVWYTVMGANNPWSPLMAREARAYIYSTLDHLVMDVFRAVQINGGLVFRQEPALGTCVVVEELGVFSTLEELEALNAEYPEHSL